MKMIHILDAPDQPDYFSALIACIESANLTNNTSQLALTKGFYDGWIKAVCKPQFEFIGLFSGGIKLYLQNHTPSTAELKGYAFGWTFAWRRLRGATPVGLPYEVMCRECMHLGRMDIFNDLSHQLETIQYAPHQQRVIVEKTELDAKADGWKPM